jgi:hypothetical protein
MPLRKIIIIILSFVASVNVFARQQTADLGLFLGGSIPFTDYSSMYFTQSVKPGFGLFYRYNFNTRYAIRINGTYGNAGAVGHLDDPDVELSFNKPIADFGVLFEVNYLDFMLGEKLMKFSPYVFYGLGLSFYPGADGNFVISPNIPFGLGVKYAIGKRFGIGAEFSMRKLFNDELDNLDNPYSELNLTQASDLFHNNDWVNYFGLTLTYKFFRGRKPCPAY